MINTMKKTNLVKMIILKSNIVKMKSSSHPFIKLEIYFRNNNNPIYEKNI
jgi:hypothetical protein